MAIAAQRFKFLDQETNLPTIDFEAILDNSIYNNPSIDELYSDTTQNLVNNLIGNDLLLNFQDALNKYSSITPATLTKIVNDLINDPDMLNSIKTALSMFNITSANYADAVNYLINSMASQLSNSTLALCNSPSILNAAANALRSSLLGRSTQLLNTKYNYNPISRCPALSNTTLERIPPSKPSAVLDFIELKNAIEINSPSRQNSANNWVSKDTVEFIKLPYTKYQEKETLYINKVLLYRAIYFSYKYTNSNSPPSSNISFPITFDEKYIINFIKAKPFQESTYIEVARYLDATNASAKQRLAVKEAAESAIFNQYSVTPQTWQRVQNLTTPNSQAADYTSVTTTLPSYNTKQTYNATYAMSLVTANPTQDSTYYYVSLYVNSTNATFEDRRLLKKSIQVYLFDRPNLSISPKAWEIINDLTIEKANVNYPIDTAPIQSRSDIYLYYLPRYVAVMKEFVTNPIYYETIKKYIPLMSINTSTTNTNTPLENDLLNHVNDVYNYFKSRQELFALKNYSAHLKELCEDVPTNLTRNEIDYLIVSLPPSVFDVQLASKVSPNDYYFVQ